MNIFLKSACLVLTLGVFSQVSQAQSEANMGALKQIAGIVAGINHFPSDSDMATLEAIMSNSELVDDIRIMADTVANIEHSPNEEGVGAMETIASSDQVPEAARELAEIIASFSHMASADAKAQLAKLFPE